MTADLQLARDRNGGGKVEERHKKENIARYLYLTGQGEGRLSAASQQHLDSPAEG
jgi:hypothetical protein